VVSAAGRFVCVPRRTLGTPLSARAAGALGVMEWTHPGGFGFPQIHLLSWLFCDVESKMRYTCGIDHPGYFQIDVLCI